MRESYMGCLSTIPSVGHFYPAITTVKSSLSPNGSTRPTRSRNRTFRLRRKTGEPPPPEPKPQPSVEEVERAIGAGTFRDDDDTRPVGSAFFDLLSSSPIGQPESEAEKQLRQVGEWFVDNTDSWSRYGQEMLMAVCLGILPAWLLLLGLASGFIKLPFSVPFLDDLLM